MQIDLFDTNTKSCNKCKKEKPKSEFSKDKSSKDGLKTSCKLCQKKYYESNKVSIRERQKKYYESNKDSFSQKSKEYYEANKASLIQKQKEYYEANKDSLTEYHKKYKEKNKDKYREYKKKYREANKDRVRESQKKYRKNKRHLVNAWTAKRRAAKLEATPDWLTEDHYNQIKDMYWLAQDLKAITGEDYHVDHIIPLQGEEVRGLHVPWNLQVLPADINISKGNRLEDGSTEA